MTSKKKQFCDDCWFADLHMVGENIRILIDDVDALCTKRPLGPDPAWHTELLQAGLNLHTAFLAVEAIFERQGLRETGELLQVTKSDSPLN
jgi:hypothetical protein